ncbi:hypothetical protein [Flavobacterium sp.]|jgi:hypothetical protein|uniref:hypothetical protein n=1 Tax=Flavobacterium sp. TaxID=239 RepID=UPI0037BF56DD
MNLATLIPTLATAMHGASALTQAERAAELQPGSDAITAARRGQRKMRAQHWMALADVANVAEALAKLGIASNLAAEIQAAHAALADVFSHQQATGRWECTAPQLAAIDELLWIYGVQINHCSHGELDAAKRHVREIVTQARAGNGAPGTVVHEVRRPL